MVQSSNVFVVVADILEIEDDLRIRFHCLLPSPPGCSPGDCKHSSELQPVNLSHAEILHGQMNIVAELKGFVEQNPDHGGHQIALRAWLQIAYQPSSA